MDAAKHGGFIDHVYWERESDDFGMLKGIRNGVWVKKRARRSGSNGGAIKRCKVAVDAETPVIREIKVSRSIESRSFLDNSPRSSLIPSLCAYDPESPPDESEISDYDESMPKLGKIFSSEECECEIGEARREGSKDETESKSDLCTLEPTQRGISMLQGCRNVDEFERLNRIGEGTYGVVYRARNRKTGEIVALKQVKMVNEREEFPLTSLREIDILMYFHHPSIVELKEVVTGSNLDSIFMVMEYVEHDLKALIEIMKQPFSQSEVKCLMLQLLQGVQCLHSDWVFHRDLKTSNLLLNNHGQLKICDFGLARKYGSSLGPYTQMVVTLWYRAPELLLGAKEYSTAVDMWSVGCIMAELLSKEPLFDGKTELDQLDKIFRILGTPNETIWPGLSKLPGGKAIFVKHRLPALDHSGVSLRPALVAV